MVLCSMIFCFRNSSRICTRTLASSMLPAPPFVPDWFDMQVQNPFGSLYLFQHFPDFSVDGTGFSWSKRLCLRNEQFLHEPAEFLLRKLLQHRFIAWLLEPLFRQTLVLQDISCAVPIQRLDSICPPSAKQIKRRLFHFLSEMTLYQRGQAVYLLAYARITIGVVIVLYPAEIKHGCVPSRTLQASRYPCLAETLLPRHVHESRSPSGGPRQYCLNCQLSRFYADKRTASALGLTKDFFPDDSQPAIVAALPDSVLHAPCPHALTVLLPLMNQPSPPAYSRDLLCFPYCHMILSILF